MVSVDLKIVNARMLEISVGNISKQHEIDVIFTPSFRTALNLMVESCRNIIYSIPKVDELFFINIIESF